MSEEEEKEEASKSRNLSEIILNIESMVQVMLSMITSHDFTIKVLSNKLNSLMVQLESKQLESIANKKPFGSVEAVVDTGSLLIKPEEKSLIDKAPTGFRRVSREETFVKHDTKENPDFTFKTFELPQNKTEQPKVTLSPKVEELKPEISPSNNVEKVSVTQRVTDKNGKALFLANIKIFDDKNNEVQTTKTGSIGQWSATLSPGNYKIIVSRRDPITKEKIDIAQDVEIPGANPTFNLNTLIIK